LFLVFFLSHPSYCQRIRPLKLGIHNYGDGTKIKKRVAPLVKYLASILKRPVKLVITKNYQELLRRFISRELILAIVPPYAYAKLSEIYSSKLLASLKINGSSYYRGAIIVRRDDDIEELNKLKGKVFGFVSKDSASGYLYPLVKLAKNGINSPRDFFKDIKFLETHSNVIKALVEGKIDGGAVFEGEITNFASRGGDISNIKIILRTSPIPYDAFIAQTHVPDDICKLLTSSMTKYEYLKNGPKGNFFAQWEFPKAALYDSVKEAMKFTAKLRERNITTLKFGIYPRRDVKKQLDNAKGLMKYLEKELGCKVIVKFSPNYLDVGHRLLVGDVDFAILSPFTYVQTADISRIKPVILGQQSIHGTTHYRSVILSKKFKSIEDAKNGVLVLVDPNSASGRLIPTAYFQKNGINITTFFKKVYYAGSHYRALEDLLSGRADLCGISSSTYHFAMKKLGKPVKNLNLLYKSDPIPREVFAARGNLPQELIKKLKNALMKLNNSKYDKDKKILKKMGYDELVPATDSVYDPLRKLIKLATRKKK
jgi:phosphate/phosphite/phosphonate ABC transporter binding protein